MIKLVISVGVAITIAAFVYAFYPKGPLTEVARSDFSQPQEVAMFETSGPISPIPEVSGLDIAKVELGARLFSDPILSQDNSLSCASCHNFDLAGGNGLDVSVGMNGSLKHINVPTVFNSSLNFKQFWDGRAETLEEQVSGPILDPLELGSTWEGVVGRLQKNNDYVAQFNLSYSEGITKDTVSHALAEFERSLLTPNSPFDRYLKGDEQAMTSDARAGYELFLSLGCVRCHQGVGMGGNMFQRMGAKNDYFASRGDENTSDLGRFNVTGDEFDKYRFKVPSLRNVALTAPYFHDGSAPTLVDAVGVMARYQLGRHLEAEELQNLVAFLSSLTGEYKGQELRFRDPEQ